MVNAGYDAKAAKSAANALNRYTVVNSAGKGKAQKQFPRVSVANAAVDCPLPWLASDYRRVVRRRRFDTLWLRIDDVTAALGARRYAADGAVTFVMEGGGWPHDVEPQSRWRLVVEDGVGTCVPAVGCVDGARDGAGPGRADHGQGRRDRAARSHVRVAGGAVVRRAVLIARATDAAPGPHDAIGTNAITL